MFLTFDDSSKQGYFFAPCSPCILFPTAKSRSETSQDGFLAISRHCSWDVNSSMLAYWQWFFFFPLQSLFISTACASKIWWKLKFLRFVPLGKSSLDQPCQVKAWRLEAQTAPGEWDLGWGAVAGLGSSEQGNGRRKDVQTMPFLFLFPHQPPGAAILQTPLRCELRKPKQHELF